jgi:S-adenosylmethionine/arginine decarboxylase-like enzyme
MVAYGKPIIEHFGSGNKAGFTLLQLIETSNITAHFVEETNDIYVDIFSCKDFDEKEAEKVIMNFFQPHNIDTVVIPRQAKEKMC